YHRTGVSPRDCLEHQRRAGRRDGHRLARRRRPLGGGSGLTRAAGWTRLTVRGGVMSMADRMTLPSDADHTGRDLGTDELALLREVIESGTLNCTRGTQVKEFERAFAARYGVAHARAVTSGTAACHAAIAAIDPEPGDEVVTTAITELGAIAPILYQLAIPVFADVDPVSLNVTPESVAAHITPRTRAIIVTHLFGNPCDVVAIRRIADAHGI